MVGLSTGDFINSPHHFFESHAFFRFSFIAALTIFSRISTVLILFCNCSLTPFRIFLSRILHKCFTKGDIYGGSRVDTLTLINGKQLLNAEEMILLNNTTTFTSWLSSM